MVRTHDGDFMDDDVATLVNIEQRLGDALATLMLTPHIRAYLFKEDPQALEQAEAALKLLPDADDIMAFAAEVDLRSARTRDPLVRERITSGWICRLDHMHDGGANEEDCPHMRPWDEDYCSACSPFQCHHEHGHP